MSMRRWTGILLVGMMWCAGCASFPPRGGHSAWVPLHNAAAEGNLVGTMQLLQRGVDVNARDPQGYTALIAAAINGRLSVSRWLLLQGADVNAASGIYGQSGCYPPACREGGGYQRTNSGRWRHRATLGGLEQPNSRRGGIGRIGCGPEPTECNRPFRVGLRDAARCRPDG